MAIADQETFAAVSHALDNCAYVSADSMIAALAAVVEKARAEGMSDEVIDRDYRAVIGSLHGDERALFGS